VRSGEFERVLHLRSCKEPRSKVRSNGRVQVFPQGLKPASSKLFMARLKPCPFKTTFH